MAKDTTLPEPPRPHKESLVPLDGGRSLGYAEYGDPEGDPVLWFHGTPGARKQIPPDAPALAAERGIRLIGVERPGTGYSTRYRYERIIDWAADLAAFGPSGAGRSGDESRLLVRPDDRARRRPARPGLGHHLVRPALGVLDPRHPGAGEVLARGRGPHRAAIARRVHGRAGPGRGT